MKKIIATLTLALSGLAHADSIKLEHECYPMADLLSQLKNRFSEMHLLEGISDRNAKMMMFASPKKKTYTIILHELATDRGCVIDGGEKLTTAKSTNV